MDIDLNIMSDIIRDGGMVPGNLENGAWMETFCGDALPVTLPPVTTPPVAQDGGVPLGLREDYAYENKMLLESRATNVNNNKETKDSKIVGWAENGGDGPQAIGLQNSDADQSERRKFKGVTWYKRTRRWEAYVWATIDDYAKQYHLGSFSSQEEAAKAYDLALIKLRGEKAKTNFPREMYNQDDFLVKHGNDDAKDFIIALKNEFLLRQGLKPRAHAVQKRKKVKRKDVPRTKKSKVTEPVTNVVDTKSSIKHETPNPVVTAPVACGRYEEPSHHESLWRPEESAVVYQNNQQFAHNQPNMSRLWPQMGNNNAAMYNPGLGVNAARMGPFDNYLAGLHPNVQQQQQPMQDRYLESGPTMMRENHTSQRPLTAEAMHGLLHENASMGNVNLAEQYRSMTRHDVRGERHKDLISVEDLLQIDWRSIFPDEYAA
eukprot:jgi/Picsp_1/2856/NSC_01081-R1_transcription factor apetala2